MVDRKFNPKAVLLARLTEDEIRDLANFDCDDEEMNRFFRIEAFDEQERGMNTTILLYYRGELAAACSICCDAISLSKQEKEEEGVPYAKVPAIKIARLGRDIKFKGLGFGRLLIDYVKSTAFDLNDETVGVRFLTLDAYPQKIGYYEALGFVKNQNKRPSRDGNISMRADIFD
ncbi:MAG: GNAT family N-acetyltransferase [Firmicutes bacterium]|nr:GNAT family N-acetyltransferase [Bacillota bacterium]